MCGTLYQTFVCRTPCVTDEFFRLNPQQLSLLRFRKCVHERAEVYATENSL